MQTHRYYYAGDEGKWVSTYIERVSYCLKYPNGRNNVWKPMLGLMNEFVQKKGFFVATLLLWHAKLQISIPFNIIPVHVRWFFLALCIFRWIFLHILFIFFVRLFRLILSVVGYMIFFSFFKVAVVHRLLSIWLHYIYRKLIRSD